MSRLIHKRINGIKYRLALFGNGGTAYLYKGTPSQSGHHAVTLKLLKRRYLLSSDITQRFAYEQRVVKLLKHRGMLNIIRCGKIRRRPYYAYHYIEGETLLKRMQCTLSVNSREIAAITKKLLINVSKLHDATTAIIHGDLSLENILLGDEGPVIIDFGSAQLLNEHKRVPDSRWIGKASYLSPEQAQGNRWDERSDLYQVGIIFYELLTLRKYNQGGNTNEKRLFAASPPKPDFSNIPYCYHSTLNGLLASQPAQRIESAKEAIKMLDIAIQFDDEINST